MRKVNKHNSAVNQKNSMVTIKRILAYIGNGYTFRFIIVLVCILFSALAGVAGSLFIEKLINDYILPLLLASSPVFTGLLKAILLMGVIYLIGIGATLLYNRIMVTISQGILKDIRDNMFAHMQHLPIRYFDTNSHGDIMSHFTNDTDTLLQLISQSIPQLFSSVITIVVVFFSMLFMSAPMTILVLICVAGMLIVSRSIAGKSGSYFVKQQTSIGAINGYIEEMINGQKVVKVFCYENKAKQIFDVHNDTLFGHADAANKYANILMPVMQNLGNMQYVLVAIIGGIMAITGVGGVSLGLIAAFLQLSRSFSHPVTQISQQLNSVVMALAGAERIFTLMDEQPETDGGYVTLVNARIHNGIITEVPEHTGVWAWKHPHGDGTLTYTELKGDVRFFDVDFEYEKGRPILQDVSLYAEPGQKVALVGATGAGKTTITNLINRFYGIADGKIRYDGININKIKKDDLRHSLGIVLQDTSLFTGTVKENIRYGKPDASDEEVKEAARLANADDFILRLPNGYDTELTSAGAGLSQGQRQLISIARAAIADPPVMILDEATSSIDTRTETIVQKGMDSLMKGRTVFVIAHRLSTVQNSDVIIVLDRGKIMERGSHDELIAQKGMYWQLYTGAFELE